MTALRQTPLEPLQLPRRTGQRSQLGDRGTEGHRARARPEGEPLDRDTALSAGHTAVTGGPDRNRVQLHDTAVSTFTGVSWSPSSISPSGTGHSGAGGDKRPEPGARSPESRVFMDGAKPGQPRGRDVERDRRFGPPPCHVCPFRFFKASALGSGVRPPCRGAVLTRAPRLGVRVCKEGGRWPQAAGHSPRLPHSNLGSETRRFRGLP